VATFGSIMLSRYHREFVRAVPRLPPDLTQYFSNPLMLMQMRPQIEARAAAAGPQAVDALFLAVRTSLAQGLALVFFWSAVIMSGAVILHLFLRAEPLRTRMVDPEASLS
jgi:hypothetical protein